MQEQIKEQNRRWPWFLPSVFTGLNMACGFASIMAAIHLDFYKASMFLILGVLFDSVDGRIARLTGTESTSGEQFDSLSDVVSFGVAPAILFYQRFLIDFNRVGLVISFFFILCGAMRLARFNANIGKIPSDYFQGLPIPLGALGVVGYTLLSLIVTKLLEVKVFAIIYLLFYSILMISNIPFPSFKHSQWVKKHKWQVLLLVFLILSMVLVYEEFMVLLMVSCYVISSITYYLLNQKKYENIFNGSADDDVLH